MQFILSFLQSPKPQKVTVFTVNPIMVKCQSSSPASSPPLPFLRIRFPQFLHQLLHLIKNKYTHQVIPSSLCKTSITNTSTEKKIQLDYFPVTRDTFWFGFFLFTAEWKRILLVMVLFVCLVLVVGCGFFFFCLFCFGF